MKYNRLLQEIAQVHRDQQAEERRRLDDRWDSLSGGEFSAEEEAELRALAATSDEAREAYEAFSPLGPEFQARIVEKARSELAPPTWRLLFRRAAARVEEFQARVVEVARNARIEVWFGTAAAVAAALYLIVVAPPPPPLPPITAVLAGEIQISRGGEASPTGGPKVFGPGSQLTLKVTPTTAVRGVVAQAFLSSRSQKRKIVPWNSGPPVAVNEKGVVTLVGTVGQEIRLAPGEWTICIVVGRPHEIPPASKLESELRFSRPQADSEEIRHDQWQAVCKDLRILEQASE